MRRVQLLVCTLAALVLAPGARAQGGDGSGDGDAETLPQGFGTLKQDDISIRIRTGDLEVRILPLDERVTRLLASDAYSSLRALVNSRRAAIDSVGRATGVSRPGLALVSFFGSQPNARFDPQLVLLISRNRPLRPLGIVPLSPRFSSQQLDVRGSVSAIYLYEELIPVRESFQVSYEGITSNQWDQLMAGLDRERARVTARARQSRPREVAAPAADSQ